MMDCVILTYECNDLLYTHGRSSITTRGIMTEHLHYDTVWNEALQLGGEDDVVLVSNCRL